LQDIGQRWLESEGSVRTNRMTLIPIPLGRQHRIPRDAFDAALARVHYAGSCGRVGRCMRLLIVDERAWVGGIVLGSTFPNIDVRDRALNLKRWCNDTRQRGIRNPWARENLEYWRRLQRIVNHARTFVFPDAQGRGVGIQAHKLLLRQGVSLWEERYADRVGAFDTLCDSQDSGLFLRNGWQHVGKTAGYESDGKSVFAVRKVRQPIRNNVGLRQGPRQWEVWIRMVDADALKRLK